MAAEDSKIYSTGEGSRLYGLDLLRIVLMIMVCVLHALNQFGTLFVQGVSADFTVYFSMLLEMLSVMAVNTWIIMSGYLLVRTDFKLKRFLELLMTVLFYAFLVAVVFYTLKAVFDIDIASITGDRHSSVTGIFGFIQGLFPISSEYYFFMTGYLLLYIISPILNLGAQKISKKSFQLLLVLLITWCSLIKSLIPVNFASDDAGYGFKWFVCLYFVGAYLRLHCNDNKMSNNKWLFIYMISAVINYGISVILFAINVMTGGFSYFMYVPLQYNFILNLIAAIGLFMFFKNINIHRSMVGTLKYIAGHTLGVYLLHAHPLLFNSWKGLIAISIGNPPTENTVYFLIYLFLCVFILFSAGIIVDIIRAALFKTVKWI